MKNCFIFMVVCALLFVGIQKNNISVLADSFITEKESVRNFEFYNLGNYNAFWTSWANVKETPIQTGYLETYNPKDRQWVGIPSICRTSGGRLWVGFMTGGRSEPEPVNYNVFHYSDDGGKTWSNEALCIEQHDENINLYQPHIFMVDEVMNIWLNNSGQNVIKVENPDCDNPSENMKFQKACKVLNRNAASRPTILSEKWDNIWLFVGENSQSNSICPVFASTNGRNWEEYSSITSVSSDKKWWEGQIAECNDGSLIFVSRIENGAQGGIELSFSYDGGETWTQCQGDMGMPFLSYCNKPHIQRLDSGNLLLILGYSTYARENLTAFLSEDNGKTWPYSLCLDSREPLEFFGCGYPEAANLQGDNGEIYIVWDNRFSYCEIGVSCITEDDIRAGKIVSQNCYKYNTVYRSKSQIDGVVMNDIEGVDEEFNKFINVENGTKIEDVVKKLPEYLTVINDEKRMKLYGTWVCSVYDPFTRGRYCFRFQTPDRPLGWSDSYGYMTTVVTVGDEENKKRGCNSRIGEGIPLYLLLMLLLLGMDLFFLKKQLIKL